MSWFCSVCENSFSRKDSMQRHVMSKNHNVGLTTFQTVPFSQKCQRLRFEHSFTSMIAGMTGSGKTAWVRSQRQFALPRRGSFGVIHNGSQRIKPYGSFILMLFLPLTLTVFVFKTPLRK